MISMTHTNSGYVNNGFSTSFLPPSNELNRDFHIGTTVSAERNLIDIQIIQSNTIVMKTKLLTKK